MATLMCDIVTPEKNVFSAEAAFVVVPAYDGEVGVLPLHEPLVSTLGAGEVRVTLPVDGNKDGKVERFCIEGGYVQVQNDSKVIVLADRASNVSDIDVEAQRETIESLSDKIEALPADSGNRAHLKRELEWATLQKTVAERRK